MKCLHFIQFDTSLDKKKTHYEIIKTFGKVSKSFLNINKECVSNEKFKFIDMTHENLCTTMFYPCNNIFKTRKTRVVKRYFFGKGIVTFFEIH